MERVETSLSGAVDWEVVLIVDKREQNNPHIQTRMVELNIPCELSTLAVGDFLWIARPKSSQPVPAGNALHRSVSSTSTKSSSSGGSGCMDAFLSGMQQPLPPDENSNDSAAGMDCDVPVDPRDMDAVVLDCIAERKSVSDLASSIMDQRYHEQKSRLRATGVRSQIYIVEGEIVLNIKQKAITPQTIKTCISATHVGVFRLSDGLNFIL
jgi:ERCC4-type nuclease